MRRITLVAAELAVIVLLAIALALWLTKRAAPTSLADQDPSAAIVALQERIQELERSAAQDSLRSLVARVKALEVRLQDPAKLPASPGLTNQVAAAEIEALRSRINLLENATNEDSFQSLASRLKTIEVKLREDPRPSVTPTPTASRETEQLRQGVDDLHRIARELAIRIKSLEDDRPRAAGGGFANEWQDLRRTVEQMGRSIDEFKARLTQLERAR